VIVKEFKCNEHGDFESGIGICPECGEIARRVFNSPVGINSGKAKRIDMVIEGEFARRNISNYTNAGSAPKVNYGSGEYNGIRAGWGKQQLSQIQREYAPIMPPGVSLQAPALTPGHNEIPPDKPTDGRNGVPWGSQVPTERMDLTPNE
jgi:hypothetical protein